MTQMKRIYPQIGKGRRGERGKGRKGAWRLRDNTAGKISP